MALDLKNIDLKDLDFRNVYEWPRFGRVLILLLVCAIVFYLGYYFDFSGISDQIYAKYKEEQDLKQQVKAILKSEEQMSEVVSQYPEIVKLLNQWQGQLINGDNLPDLLNQLLKIGAANHIQFTTVTPEAKKLEEDYYKVPIKVIMRGDNNQIANFISQIANLPQLVSIGSFTILKPLVAAEMEGKPPEEAKGSPNRLVCELNLEVYYLANKKS